MKILHISRTMGQGGAEKVVFQLCCDNREHDMYVASCGGHYVSALAERGVSHLLIPDIDNKNPLLMVKTCWLLWRFIRREKIDIVHTHHRMAAFYARLLQAVFHRLKHVYTAHSIFQDKTALMRFSLSKAKVVAVGKSVQENLLEQYGLPLQQVSLIYNAVKNDAEPFVHPQLLQEKQNGAWLVGCIGRISHEKGMDIFVRAMKSVVAKEPHVKAVIVGDGDEMETIRALVKELGMDQHVIFLGYQSQVLAIIRQLDFAVLSSRKEGFPLIPIEVFSQGKTMVASDIPGTNEIIKHQQNGLLFPSEDVEQLAQCIVQLVRDEDVRVTLEQCALATYEQTFSYSSFVEGYHHIYMA